MRREIQARSRSRQQKKRTAEPITDPLAPQERQRFRAAIQQGLDDLRAGREFTLPQVKRRLTRAKD